MIGNYYIIQVTRKESKHYKKDTQLYPYLAIFRFKIGILFYCVVYKKISATLNSERQVIRLILVYSYNFEKRKEYGYSKMCYTFGVMCSYM